MYGIDQNAKAVTQDELVEIIKQLDSKGMVPISFTSVTKMTTRKPNGFDKFTLSGYSGKGGETWFTKVKQVNGNIGIVYEEKVNREREKQGLDTDFVAKASPYEYVTKGVRKKGDQHYLAFYPISNAQSFEQVIVGKKGSTFEVVDKEDIADVIPEYNVSSSRQGLTEDNKVDYEIISFGSIAAVRVDGQSYIVTDIDEPRRESFNLAFE
jgi:hypothetical protein